jgi:hypothetical protein
MNFASAQLVRSGTPEQARRSTMAKRAHSGRRRSSRHCECTRRNWPASSNRAARALIASSFTFAPMRPGSTLHSSDSNNCRLQRSSWRLFHPIHPPHACKELTGFHTEPAHAAPRTQRSSLRAARDTSGGPSSLPQHIEARPSHAGNSPRYAAADINVNDCTSLVYGPSHQPNTFP